MTSLKQENVIEHVFGFSQRKSLSWEKLMFHVVLAKKTLVVGNLQTLVFLWRKSSAPYAQVEPELNMCLHIVKSFLNTIDASKSNITRALSLLVVLFFRAFLLASVV